MAMEMVSPTNSTAQDETGDEARFQEFRWSYVPKGSSVSAEDALNIAGRTMDIALGLTSVLQMIEQDEMIGEKGDGDGPRLMNKPHVDNLKRLAIATLQMLADEADRSIGKFQQEAERGYALGHMVRPIQGAAK